MNSFTEKNKQEDFEPYLIIHLDDVTITLDGYEYSLIEVQTMILEEIASHIDHLNKQGIYYISQIDIPCPPYCLPENIPLTLENKIWKIVYGADECAYYIPNSKQLL